MNKNLKEVLVRREYHGQVWYVTEPVTEIFTRKNLGLLHAQKVEIAKGSTNPRRGSQRSELQENC